MSRSLQEKMIGILDSESESVANVVMKRSTTIHVSKAEVYWASALLGTVLARKWPGAVSDVVEETARGAGGRSRSEQQWQGDLRKVPSYLTNLRLVESFM